MFRVQYDNDKVTKYGLFVNVQFSPIVLIYISFSKMVIYTSLTEESQSHNVKPVVSLLAIDFRF